MVQHSWGETVTGRSPATIAGRPGVHPRAAHRLLSLDILLAILALTGGLRVVYLAANRPAFPAEAANVAHAYALGHLTSFADAGGAGVSRFGWLQLAFYTMVSDAFGRSTTAVAAVRETMLVAAIAGIVLIWLLARRLGLSRWAATVAAVLFAASPLAVGLQHLVVVEHIAVIWALSALVLVTTRETKLWHDILAALCLIAAILTSPLALFFLPAAGWVLLRRSLTRAALVAILLNFGLGVAFGPAASVLRPHLASGGPGTVDWLSFDPALGVLSVVALVAGLFVVSLRPFALSGLLIVAATLIPGVPATAALALLLPVTPILIAGLAQAVARRRLPGHLWLSANPHLGPAVVGAVLVAALGASWLHGYAVLHPAANRGSPLEQARNWLRDNASGARLLVDDAAWAELAAAGWPTGQMAAPAACAKFCPPAEWAVFGGDPASLLSRYPALAGVLASAGRIAVFGDGDDRVTVSRLGIAPADPSAPSEDSARAHAGSALAESRRIKLSPDAAAVLRSGRADPRLIATIAALAALGPVQVAAFPEVPGEDPAGQPRRRVLLTGDQDGAAAFYAGQRDLFRPASVVRTGGGVLVTYPLFPPTGLLVPFSSP